MFLMNNTTNLVQMSMKGLTATPGAGGTGKAAVVSLDPTGSITTASPYVQNCSSVNAGATATSTTANSTDGSFNITMTISGSDGSSQPFALAVVNSGTGSLDTSGYSGTFSASAL